MAPEVQVHQVPPPPKSAREQVATRGLDEAFVVRRSTADADGQFEYVYFVHAGECFRIDKVPLGNRPYGGLAWASNRYLVFDRWSEPHYGLHYVVDVGK